ncbi:phage/plasmid-like protein (TIGR03299 family) [Kineococcus xinjiangensis]|uniref:Phage/plasmid-like protein (TIGR03299 family) n=1 Tax=Kineococcus xinjiangensis TaxID=512762 RepID=A0A2S6IBZ6_9ACTN|nr:DUF932 domain-containing protein [Kineococcus xinjiangensis]PPK90215.1 phage/plasmid-like protein (TIGR03299 family) [Kineococcus xinjiangensis]
MSRETLTWLNQNTVIGFTDLRGNAWHRVDSLQGERSNHYPGAVPFATVAELLRSAEVASYPVSVRMPATLDDFTCFDENNRPVRDVRIEDRQAITRISTGAVHGIFSGGYQVHQFDEWLLNKISNLVGDTLSIGSAGLLKGGAVAWVSIELPENITTREGVTFRPNLLACTSHDGSLATTFKRVVTVVVCDNTLSAALGEKGQQVKVKHSRYADLRLTEARDALNMLEVTADAFQDQVRALCETTVTDRQWSAFLDRVAPIEGSNRSKTIARNKQDGLDRMWRHDSRVTDWKGTGWGVVQAVNTWEHWEKTVKGAERDERNRLRAVTGGVDDLDRSTVTTLNQVLATV